MVSAPELAQALFKSADRKLAQRIEEEDYPPWAARAEIPNVKGVE